MESVFRNWASDDEVTKFLTWPTHKSVEGSMGYINFCLGTYSKEDSYQWGIELKETGELFGNISVVGLEEEVGANRVCAKHDTNNPNSGKVMEKAGIKYEGTLRQCARNNQGIVDCAVYSILKEEYEVL